MKKLNLIKRLLSYSHEKQKPQRFGRYAAMLIMLLSLGVGQMWAYDPIDVYCAIDDATLGSYNLRCNYNGYGGASDHWIQCVMTNTGYTYNGKLLYKGTFTPDNSGANYLQFQLYNGDTWVAEYAPINNSWIVTNTFAGKINEYGQTTWNTYGYDIYYVNTNNWGSVYAYAYNSESDKNADWPGAQMTKTDKTYEGHDIYRVIVTKTYAKVIFNCGSDACKTSDLTLGAKTSSQVYNNGNWYPYPTWYWIIGNGAQNGSENFTKQVFQETATVGVYTLTRNITQGETFHIGNGTYGYGPSSNTNVTGTSSDLALTQYGPVYWFTFTSTSREVIFTLNTNNMTLSLASVEEHAINYYDEGGSDFSGVHGDGYPTKHTYGSETALVSPTKTGYVFAGWYTSSSCTGDPVTSLGATDYNDAISLYAKWTALPIVYIMKSKGANTRLPHGFTALEDASKLTLWAWSTADGNPNFYTSTSYPGPNANDINDTYVDDFGDEWYRFIPNNTSHFNSSTNYGVIVSYNGSENTNKIYESNGDHKYCSDGENVTDCNSSTNNTYTGSIWIIPKGTDQGSAILYTENPATLLWSLQSDGLKVGDFDKIGEDTYQLTVLASAITNYGAVCFSYNGKNYKLGNCSLHTEYYSQATAATLTQGPGNFNWTGSPTGQIILTIFKSSGDWKIYYTPSYQVIYDDNGATGSVPTDANYYTSGTSVTIKGNSGNLVKTGYNFAGWNGNASGTGTDYTPAGTFSISDNTTLYAKWTPKNFSITYKDQGDAAFSGEHASGYPTSHTYNTATALKSASKFGYTFDGWFTSSACTGSAVTELGATGYTADIVLYAKWTINNHNITRTAPSHGSLSIKVGSADAVNTNTTSDYNQTVVLTTTPDFGYYLTGLTVTKSDDPSTVVSVSNNTFTMPDYNVTITATYALRYGLIGEAADGENRGMPGTDVASAADFTFSSPNLVCARNLDPNTTYLFKVYDRARTALRGYTTENTVLETGDSEELSGTYDLKINTAGRGEYTFKITSVTNNAEAYPTVTVDRPTSYQLTLKHGNTEDGHSYGGTVTAVATESATETAITDGQYVAAEGSIAFTTTVPSGYTFGGWFSDDDYETEYVDDDDVIEITDDGEGNHTLTISSIAADVAVYAKYTGNTYTLSYDATTNGGDRIDVTKPVTMGRAYGDLPIAYKYGYTFLGWYTAPEDGTLVTNETIVTIASNHTIYAQFQEISYVYFYDNLNWGDNVYVTFNAYWDEDGKGAGNDNGSGNYGRPYYKMEPVEGCTNVYRCQIPSYLTDKDWQYNICFNNQKKLNKLDPLPTTGDWNNFDSGEAVFRRDFDSYATMFVPDPTEKVVSKNGVQYYSTDQWVDHQDNDPAKAIIDYRYTKGYWRKYNPNDYSDTYAGYVIKGSWDGEKHDYYFKRTAGLLGTDTFSVTVHLEKGQTYNFRIYKHCRTNNTYSSWLIQNSGNTITGTITDADNYTLNMAIAKSETDKKDHITATVAGEYTFKLACGRDGVLQLLVDYPEIAADGNWYRALYTWTDGSGTHTRVCKTFKRIDNSGTTWFEAFIHKSDAVTSRSLKLQKCTGITSNEPAWTDVVGGGITLSDDDITETGVYTFTVTRYSGQQPTGSFNEKYDGVYYIRTDATEGGWDYYNSFGGYKMDYSAYSLTQTLSEPYSHYYCKFVDNTTTSVAFTVATYNSPSICDTLKNTDGIVTNTYSFLPDKANVRFSYNEQTNALTRAYLKPATGDGNARYLVLHGKDTKVMDKDGSTIAKKGDGAEDMKANELLFSDEGDWIYSVTLKASPVAKASLIARYNGADRYLIGGAESYETILGGTESETKYTLQATYNFKTNRLLMAWKPEGENISEALANVDMLWVRHAQDAAKEIKFTGSGSLSSIKVVGALEFDFNELYGKVGSWNTETRRLIKFFISLPFDVAISDIFGLHEAEYGEAFIVQKYNGAKRAKDGLFAQDENNFWETLTVDSVMHANEGYCLMMNNYYMHGTQGSIWENKGSGSKVYLYLPSTGSISSISGGTQTITLPEHPCKIERTFTPEGGSGTVSHKNTDANWNFMGVPLFSSYTGEATSGYPGAIFVAEGDAAEGQGYLYKWDYSTNNYSIYSGTGFNFLPMHSYLVQFAGDVTFSGSHIPASVAAHQRKEKTNYNIDLQVLNTEDELVNRTYVELRENACDTFLLNEDLYLVTNSQPVNVFSFAGNYTVGANVLSVNNHIVPLGLIVRQNGTYTFSMPSNFSGTVTLLDTYAQTRTNLALEDYELYLEHGTINDRFFLEININNAPTAIDGVTDGSGSLKDGKAHKFIENGVMYILKDGEIFDARGNRVK